MNTSLCLEFRSISLLTLQLGTGNSSFSTSSDAFSKSTHVLDTFLRCFGLLSYSLFSRRRYLWLSPWIICNLSGFAIAFFGFRESSWARCNRFSSINRFADNVSNLFMRPCFSYVCRIDLTVESILFSTAAISRRGIRCVLARWIICSRSSKDKTLLGCNSLLSFAFSGKCSEMAFGDDIWVNKSSFLNLIFTRGKNPSSSFWIDNPLLFSPESTTLSILLGNFLVSFDYLYETWVDTPSQDSHSVSNFIEAKFVDSEVNYIIINY